VAPEITDIGNAQNGSRILRKCTNIMLYCDVVILVRV